MATVTIPFLVSDTNYELACPIDNEQLTFDTRWNSRDNAFYFDLYESDDTIICLNVKVVCGVPLGRRSQHPWFDTHIITAIDTSRRGRDPGFDDLNSRVLVVVETIES
jgi:hypothetical protein